MRDTHCPEGRIAPSSPFLSERPTLWLPGWPGRVYTKGMVSWGLQRAGASHKSLYCHSLSLRVMPFPSVVVLPSLESQVLVASTVAFLETRKMSVREVGQWSLQILFLKVYLEELLDPGRRIPTLPLQDVPCFLPWSLLKRHGCHRVRPGVHSVPKHSLAGNGSW